MKGPVGEWRKDHLPWALLLEERQHRYWNKAKVLAADDLISSIIVKQLSNTSLDDGHVFVSSPFTQFMRIIVGYYLAIKL